MLRKYNITADTHGSQLELVLLVEPNLVVETTYEVLAFENSAEAIC